MSLKDEIDSKSKTIRTDSYQMSIGELSNLYRDDEMDIHPEFQRIYRWSDAQKTRLIESILLGIPLPPIFVSQREDGVWDVIDGVQRLSTIFQFMGFLKDEKGIKVGPLVMSESKQLPSLGGKYWRNPTDKKNSLTKDEQLYIKRSKIDVKIVLKESDDNAKYELFMRLNTGGTRLSEQEVRNCLMIMAYPETFGWLKELSEYQSFKDTISLSSRSIDENYHMELAYRFLVFRSLDETGLSKVGDLGEFLDDKVAHLNSLMANHKEREEKIFKAVFKVLYEAMESDSFRRFDDTKKKHTGGFSISAFETIAMGLGFNDVDKIWKTDKTNLKAKIQKIWSTEEFVENSGGGIRASTRIPKIVALGRRVFHQ